MRTALYIGGNFAQTRDADSLVPPMLLAAYRRFAAWRRIRTAIRQLSELPDRMLADMGIPPSEIEHLVRHGRPQTFPNRTGARR